MIAAVKRRRLALEFASPRPRSSRAVVLAAVKSGGMAALHFASSALRADPDVVVATLWRTCLALQFAASELAENGDFVRVAVEIASTCLRADGDAVLVAGGGG